MKLRKMLHAATVAYRQAIMYAIMFHVCGKQKIIKLKCLQNESYECF